MHDFEEKYVFNEHDLKNISTQKITFCFNIPRKMREF